MEEDLIPVEEGLPTTICQEDYKIANEEQRFGSGSFSFKERFQAEAKLGSSTANKRDC